MRRQFVCYVRRKDIAEISQIPEVIRFWQYSADTKIENEWGKIELRDADFLIRVRTPRKKKQPAHHSN